MTGILISTSEFGHKTLRENGHVEMEAEAGVTLTAAEESQGLQGTARS